MCLFNALMLHNATAAVSAGCSESVCLISQIIEFENRLSPN